MPPKPQSTRLTAAYSFDWFGSQFLLLLATLASFTVHVAGFRYTLEVPLPKPPPVGGEMKGGGKSSLQYLLEYVKGMTDV